MAHVHAAVAIAEAQILSPCPAMWIAASAENFDRPADPIRLYGRIFAPLPYFRQAVVSIHREWAIRDIARVIGVRLVAGKWEARILSGLSDQADGHMAGARLRCERRPLQRRIIACLFIDMYDPPQGETNLVAIGWLQRHTGFQPANFYDAAVSILFHTQALFKIV